MGSTISPSVSAPSAHKAAFVSFLRECKFLIIMALLSIAPWVVPALFHLFIALGLNATLNLLFGPSFFLVTWRENEVIQRRMDVMEKTKEELKDAEDREQMDRVVTRGHWEDRRAMNGEEMQDDVAPKLQSKTQNLLEDNVEQHLAKLAAYFRDMSKTGGDVA